MGAGGASSPHSSHWGAQLRAIPREALTGRCVSVADTDHTWSGELQIRTLQTGGGLEERRGGAEMETDWGWASSSGKGTVEENATEVSSVTQRYIKTSLPRDKLHGLPERKIK